MKILAIHNRYQIRGGEDESFDLETSLLEKNGHQVIRYIKDNKIIDELPLWQVGLRTIWSRSDYRSIRGLIQKERVDLAHIQNHFPLVSPSAYYAAKHEGIPVVQSLRNYRLYCLNSYLFREQKVCEDCLGKSIPLPGVVHKCYRNSRLGSTVVTASISTHRLLKTYQTQVDAFIVLTEFAKQKYIHNGIPAEKVFIKPNFVDPDPKAGRGDGGFVLFVGRLSAEKGISVLLRAWEVLGKRTQLKIVGEGPLQSDVEAAAVNTAGIQYLGRQSLADVYDLIGQATALIFPSLWYEGMPRVIIEAFAKGTPVIASYLGAMVTMIEHQKTGLHFQVGNSDALIEQVFWMLDHPQAWSEMRQAARSNYELNYTAEQNYQMLMQIYQRVLGSVSRVP
ncbi:glycosyltransferase [Almyronema epifaneia]|uniref:Glycosyltransferase n=1 Tax=Almyronema epifaneia S1 TaxID=2991925 RepID=A0ABW6II68_9CYAN